jgi:hypothetical protein
MKNLRTLVRIARYPLVGASIATVIMVWVLYFWGTQARLDPGQWSGWVQAVGSISAILISVGLMDHQIKEQQKGQADQAREETRRICLAVRDELMMLQKMFTESSRVVALLALQPGEIFDVLVPPVVPNERFSIYRSVIGRLTQIDDDQLRQDIIWTYETAISQIHAGMQNNQLLFDLRDFDAAGYGPERAEQRQFHVSQLLASATGMQYLCKQTIERVNALLPALDRAAGRG